MKRVEPGFALLLFLVTVPVLAILLSGPPSPLPETAPAHEFSAYRALRHLEVIAREPRPIGSVAHGRSRDYLVETLRRLGLEPQIQDAGVIRSLNSLNVGARVRNILARMEGTAGSGAILLSAHYDSVVVGPGASDDGAGVAALLETLRALQAGPRLSNDVIFLFTDGEEMGLLGAEAFVREHPWAKDVALVLNFEARGNTGSTWLFETSPLNSALVRRLGSAVRHPATSSTAAALYRMLPNDTDFSRFLESGMKGLNFAYFQGVTHYHTRLDNLENLNLASLQHHGSYALPLVRHFGNFDFQRGETSQEAVYFTLLDTFLIVYNQTTAGALTLTAGVFLMGLLGVALYRRRLSILGPLGGFLGLLLCAFLVLLCNTALWLAVRFLDPEYAWMPLGHSYASELFLFAHLFLSVALAVALFGGFLKRPGSTGPALGSCLVWLGLALALEFYLPAAAYFFTWPLLLNIPAFALALWLDREAPRPGSGSGWLQAAVLGAGATAGLIIIVPTVYQLYFAFPQFLAGVTMIPIALLVGLLSPQLGVARRWMARIVPLAALSASALFLAAGLWLNRFTPEQPKPNSVLYGMDADAGEAVWASTDWEVDEWTRQFLGDSPRRGPLAEFVVGTPLRVLRAAAPPADLPPPAAELLERRLEGEDVRLVLRLKSLRQAPNLGFELLPSALVRQASLQGRPLQVENFCSGTYYAAPPEGIQLEVTIPAGQPVRLRLIDQSYGLPVLPEFDYRPRPAEMMPTPIHSALQDSTLVKKSYSF